MELVKYDMARKAIIEASNVDEVKQIMDKSEAMRVYARQAKDFEMLNRASEIRIRAERRLGEMLKAQKEAGLMAKPSGSNQYEDRSQGDTDPLTLADMGISKSMSSRAQATASIPELEFETIVSEHHNSQKELTSNTVRKLAIASKCAEINEFSTALPEGKYQVIYADPPWRYEHVKTTSRAVENQYPTMELDDICDLPVSDLAADDSVLYLWATSPKLAESMRVIEDWGFIYRTCAIWDKKKIGMGYYFRQQHELLLVAAKGKLPTPSPSDRKPSVFSFKRGEHSAKPVEVIEMLNSMYPDRSKIELFCRNSQPGWNAWGNQSGL